jgi:hypothetical protein
MKTITKLQVKDWVLQVEFEVNWSSPFPDFKNESVTGTFKKGKQEYTNDDVRNAIFAFLYK